MSAVTRPLTALFVLCCLSGFALEVRGQATPIATTTGAQSLTECEIVARIDGQVVQACEVIWKVNQILADNQGKIPPSEVDNVRQMLMQRQIAEIVDTKLIYGEFQRNVPAENQKSIDTKLREPFDEQEAPRVMKQLKVSNYADLERRLLELGSSLDDLRRSFKERVVAGEWLRSNIEYNEEVTHAEMLSYYNEHLADYQYPTQARWEELMVRKNHFNDPRSAWEAIANLGNEAWTRAQDNQLRGPIFGELAKASSHGVTAAEGGLHPWTEQGALKATAVDTALFSLEVGQLSDILVSEPGFHIVRVLERKPAGRTPFTEVQNAIRERLKQQRFNAAVEHYLTKLRREARIWTAYTGNTTYELLAQPPGGPPRR